MPHPRLIALIAVALVAGAAAPAGAIEKNPRKAIVVYAGADEAQAVASFKRVKCAVVRRNGNKKLDVAGRSGGWKLHAVINDFDGFHEYDVDYGGGQANFELDPPGGGGYYSNIFEPDDHPPFGGKANPTRKKFGLGFINAFKSSGGGAVGIVGFAKCR